MSSLSMVFAKFVFVLQIGFSKGIHMQGQDSNFLASGGTNFLASGGTTGASVDSEVSAEIRETLQSVANDLLLVNPVEGQASVHEALKAIAGKMDIKQALKTMDSHRLPQDVQALIKTTSETTHGVGFDETSMAKARLALNDLVEKAWVELDDKIIECKEYQEMNRATFDQVVIDMSRLAEQITDLQRIETESSLSIAKFDMEIRAVHDSMERETRIYNYNRAKKSRGAQSSAERP